MNPAIESMLERYDCSSAGDYENALREIFQELALLGLWRGKFFEHAAFYGGTALRILHGLDRFSEDMDFSLLAPQTTFDLSPYCAFMEKELASWGFPVNVSVKKKTANSAVESAFLKADTLQQMMLIDVPSTIAGRIQSNQALRIKVEVDTNPPQQFSTESKFLLQPIPFSVRAYTPSSLFAGKIHALLFRKWGRRVKGRDWYDFVWYAANRIPLDMVHLTERMRQTGHWTKEEPLNQAALSKLLHDRIDELDINAALRDVEPFLKRTDSVSVWSRNFFTQVAEKITVRTSEA